MSKAAVTAASLTVLISAQAAAQTPTPAPGIPLEVATRRAEIVKDLRYELALNVPRDQKSPITGTMTARFALSDASQPLVMDFAPGGANVKGVTVNGDPAAATFPPDHIVVPAGALSQARPRSGSSSPPATPRSTATPTSSTRCSCRRGRTWRFPSSISPI